MNRVLVCVFLALLLNAQESSNEANRVGSAATKILWRAPRPMTVQDWVCGPGGCDRAPYPPYHFVKEDLSGTNPKITVRDAKGSSWSVKFGAPVIGECFGARFLNALGYITEPNYLVGEGKLEGAFHVRRSRFFIQRDGTFSRARFELRDQKDFVFQKNSQWAWDSNPFVGTHELAGLKIVLMLLSDWDGKDAHEGGDANTAVFRSDGPGGPQMLYSFFDWGASLGRWGVKTRRDKSDCSGYAMDSQQFVKHARGGRIEWGFEGKHAADLKANVTLSDVRWLLPYLERITPDQLDAGLKASGANERQTRCWSSGIQTRIQQLQAIAR